MCAPSGGGLRHRPLLFTEKRKQIRVDLILVRRRHAMRRALVHLQRGAFHDLRRQQRGIGDRDDKKGDDIMRSTGARN